MRGVNKVILVGNLGHDVEVRQMTNGNPVANIRIATNERWTRRDTGQVQEHTEWHNVVLFGRRAELAQEYLQKGSRIYVEGRLRTRSWQDREGQERKSTEVVADDMQFPGSPRRRRRFRSAPFGRGIERAATRQLQQRGQQRHGRRGTLLA